MRILVKPHKSPISCNVFGPCREARILQLLAPAQLIQCRQELAWQSRPSSEFALKQVVLDNSLSIENLRYNSNCSMVFKFVRGKNEP